MKRRIRASMPRKKSELVIYCRAFMKTHPKKKADTMRLREVFSRAAHEKKRIAHPLG